MFGDSISDDVYFSRQQRVRASPASLAIGRVRTKELVDPWDQADDILARIRPPDIPNRAFPITRFGAVGNGVTDCTAGISAAIATR
jgi:polygalacturonase